MMKHNWRKTDARLYMKCLAVALHDTGLRGNALLAAFTKLVPNWKTEFEVDGPISDNAIIQRADKGRRAGYEREWPDKNKQTVPFWKQALQDVKKGRSSFGLGKARSRRTSPPASSGRMSRAAVPPD